ncbi:MAG TPA: HPr family phosphocarrier protein [Pseudomonadales bacterium]|nr:HPr family phosphocarrier protein [Pseudomonadales bacterium]
MVERELEIINKLGLHARAAAQFVKVAGAFGSEVRVAREGRDADGKSIMAVMMLAASCGTRIRVTTEGDDEEAAMEAISALVADRFGEEE